MYMVGQYVSIRVWKYQCFKLNEVEQSSSPTSIGKELELYMLELLDMYPTWFKCSQHWEQVFYL